ncbi:MAG: hypothetical protein IKE56_01545 [Lachnospiraceae bacterium]|nr:hypothetical protein [Lachnospiraceae bacterium]
MINFQDEIKRFKPSLDVDDIEDTITGIDLTDMNDLMLQMVQETAKRSARAAAVSVPAESDAVPMMDGFTEL